MCNDPELQTLDFSGPVLQKNAQLLDIKLLGFISASLLPEVF